MRYWLRSFALVAVVAVAVPFVAAPAMAGDCDGMRQFSGLVQKFKKGNKGKFVVDNRMGDKVRFVRDPSSKVVDERGGEKPAAEWDDLKNNFHVKVCWKFTDDPRKAYTVYVQEPPAEAGEDEG
jgi:hypothetical protein